MRTVMRSAAIFLAAGLAGPLIRWIVPVVPTGPDLSSLIGDFVYSVVLLLWPAQLLAVVEVNTGRLIAAVISVGANVALFAVVGAITGICSRRPIGIVSIYLVVSVMVVVLAVWASGIPLNFIEASAIVCALVLYAIPFLIVFRVSRTAF